MKYAEINERYGVLYDHAEEFPQFKNSAWILVDWSNRITGKIDLLLITEETFIDECYDITRAEIKAAAAPSGGDFRKVTDGIFKMLHKLSKFYKNNGAKYKWAVTMYMKNPFDKFLFSEIGNTEITACDAYDAYLNAQKTFPDFYDIADALEADAWYCDIVQKGAEE